MSVWRQLSRGLRALARRDVADRDLADEIQDFVDRTTEAHVARGLSPSAARRAARLDVGNPDAVAEEVRASRWESVVDTVAADVRYACRRLAAAPAHTAIVALTLALGIGVTAAVFGVVKPILVDPVPYPDPERLVVITESGDGGVRIDGTFGMYRWFAERSRVLERVAVIRPWQPGLTGAGDPVRVGGQRVSAGYFEVLGVPAALGRTLAATDDRPGDAPVVVLSDRLWRRRFSADPSIVGRAVRLDGASYTVIGVMPADFENLMGPDVDVWAPLQYALTQGRAWGHHLRTIGRLRQGVDVDAATAELDALGQRAIEDLRPETYGPNVRFGAVPLSKEVARDIQATLLTISGAVVLLLLIAAVNVTNLILARSVLRRGEFAVRVALGAGRTRLVRQVLVESVLMAILGGIGGLALSAVALRAVISFGPAGLPRVDAIRIDAPVIAAAMGVTILLGLLVGLLPALQVAQGSAHDGLQQASRRASPRHRTARSALVVAQVAIALVLLVGSGLLLRSLGRLFAISPGFDAAGLLTMQVQGIGPRFASPMLATARYGEMLEAVLAVPGVRAAAMTSQLPLSGDRDGYGVHFEAVPDEGFSTFRYGVTPGFLETLRVPLREGRFLDRRDTAGAPLAAVVSESLARLRFPDRSALGERLRIGPTDGPPYTIVGVVGDLKQMSLTSQETDAVYTTSAQWPFVDRPMSLVVRVDGESKDVAAAVRRAVWSVDPNQPIARVASLEELLAATAAERRFALIVFETFACIALALAAAGMYGVLSTLVAERSREIGVRAALGATHAAIVGLVIRQGVAVALMGVAIGLAAAAATSGLLTALLFGVSPLDPLTYGVVAASVIAVAVLASGVPAWRAARLDPVAVLRAE